jgi:hypothetical protein
MKGPRHRSGQKCQMSCILYTSGRPPSNGWLLILELVRRFLVHLVYQTR